MIYKETICEVIKNYYYLRLRLFKTEIKVSVGLYAILCTSLFFFFAFPFLSSSGVYDFLSTKI